MRAAALKPETCDPVKSARRRGFLHADHCICDSIGLSFKKVARRVDCELGFNTILTGAAGATSAAGTVGSSLDERRLAPPISHKV